MNHTLRYNTGTDTLVRSWPNVAKVDSSSFIDSISSDRLKAFKTRFSPSSESLGQKLSNYAVTAGIYAAIAAAAVGLSTANVAALLHVLHLNGV
jgi:hypothetical protein